MTEGNVFHFVHHFGGGDSRSVGGRGYPVPGLDGGGVPCSRSGLWGRGVPEPHLDGGSTPMRSGW